MYKNFEDLSPNGILNQSQLSCQQKIEIVSVDPNDGDDAKFKEVEGTHGTVAFDNVRSCSRSTFRSRTDSSSIGDYESHSSDYDDESDTMEYKIIPIKLPTNLSAKSLDDCTNNYDGDGFKKSIDDADPFAIQVDASTFDLAAFITQDDQVFYNHSTNAAVRIQLQETVKLEIPPCADSDSDVIVDVETVENEKMCVDSWDQGKKVEIVPFDNVQRGPSLDSSKHRVETKEVKPMEPYFTRNVTTVPSMRHSTFFKRKFGIGRGKNINMYRNSLQATAKSEAKNKSKSKTNDDLKNNNVEKKTKNSGVQTEMIVSIENKAVNLIKNQDFIPVNIKVEKPSTEELLHEKQVKSNHKCSSFIKYEHLNIKNHPSECRKDTDRKNVEDLVTTSQISDNLPKKRRLDLVEYTKRREHPSLLSSMSKNPYTQHTRIQTNYSVQTAMPVVTKLSTKFQIKKQPQIKPITSIVKSLNENQSSKRFVDPITEAKNKVLRWQELKKAQQIKMIDSTVNSKVARVTKLLPLKDIVKGCYKTCDGDVSGKKNSEYEEIIIVSTGCNTDITIPPNRYSNFQQNIATNLSRSLLKSKVLLANTNNSFHSGESVKISSNALIISIQDVLLKKSSPMILEATQGQQTPSSTSEHGENKIIMHLRKDRIRKRKVSQSTQTDLLPEFSDFLLSRVESTNDRYNLSASRKTKVRRKYRVRQNSFSSDEESCNYRSQGNSKSSRSALSEHTRHHLSSKSSSSSEYEDYSEKKQRHSGSLINSRGCGISSTEDRSRSNSSACFYNRNSRSRSKSSARQDSSNNVERNKVAPAVEERRIVYVGRIEQGTTKEMLRGKFVAYGPIKQVTIHYKDTGMKYGFVTYEKSEDAFRVIDSGLKDVTINMYDISFGGRRAFCRASYADLDKAGINLYEPYDAPRQVAPSKKEDSFEALLLKVKAKLNATKSSSPISKT